MSASRALKVTTPSDCEIEITREFDAPRQLVYDAMTKPEFLRRWFFGPPGWELVVCEIDLKVGGTYRYVWRAPDGMEMGMGGVWLELDPPGHMVNTQLFDEDWTGGETVGTLTLTENEGRTTLRNVVVYASKEVRDAALRSGMEEGMAAGYDRLEEMLPSFA